MPFQETFPPTEATSLPLLRVSLFVGYPALGLWRMLFFIEAPFYRSEILMAIAPKSPPPKPKHARFVFRPYRRIPTWRILYYLSGEYVGKGVATNLSQFGMRVQGEHAVEPGLNLSLIHI